MQNKIISFFQTHTRRESMLLSMIYTFIFIDIIFIIVSIHQSKYINLILNVITLFLMLILLKKYHQRKNIIIIAIPFLVMMEFNSTIALLFNSSQSFIAIFPFIYIAGFFLFLSLSDAMLATLIHTIYWSIIVIIVYIFSPQKYYEVFPIYIMNDIIIILLLMILGVFYQFVTMDTYKKLEVVNLQKKRVLKEIHNKIKNNLNFISSILGLNILYIRKHYTEDNYTVLVTSKQRIQTIALIYQDLNNQKIEQINFDLYMKNLISLINSNYQQNILVEYDIKDIYLSEESAYRLGLIVNELINHIVQDGCQKTKIQLSIFAIENSYHFIYIDNNIKHKKVNYNFGDKLIGLIIDQMEAKIEITYKDSRSYQIWFSDDR